MAASSLLLVWLYEGEHAMPLFVVAGIISAAPLVIRAADRGLPHAEMMHL